MKEVNREVLITNIIRINEAIVCAVADKDYVELQDLQILLNYYIGFCKY